MLPSKLQSLKKQLESELFLNNDDQKSLKVLQTLDKDPRLQKLINQNDLLTKSFSVAPENCPECGKRI